MTSSKAVEGRVSDLDFVILYVKSAADSANFYADLFGKPPVQSAPTFAAFELESGVKFGLWSRDDVQPVTGDAAGGSEVCLLVADGQAVRATHEAWRKRGLKIAQQPTEMDFGPTFVALDPDGHRLRVFARRAA